MGWKHILADDCNSFFYNWTNLGELYSRLEKKINKNTVRNGKETEGIK